VKAVAKIVLVLVGAGILFGMLAFHSESRLSQITVGMSVNDLHARLGMPEKFGPALDDNWYFARVGPIVFAAVDAKIFHDLSLASPDGKTFFPNCVQSARRVGMREANAIYFQ
jgi:hypothetical protein